MSEHGTLYPTAGRCIAVYGFNSLLELLTQRLINLPPQLTSIHTPTSVAHRQRPSTQHETQLSNEFAKVRQLLCFKMRLNVLQHCLLGAQHALSAFPATQSVQVCPRHGIFPRRSSSMLCFSSKKFYV